VLCNMVIDFGGQDRIHPGPTLLRARWGSTAARAGSPLDGRGPPTPIRTMAALSIFNVVRGSSRLSQFPTTSRRCGNAADLGDVRIDEAIFRYLLPAAVSTIFRIAAAIMKGRKLRRRTPA